jgi:hypothetical protein
VTWLAGDGITVKEGQLNEGQLRGCADRRVANVSMGDEEPI